MMVALSTIKNALHIDYNDDDATLTRLIETAEEMVVDATNRSLDDLKAKSADGISLPKRIEQAIVLMVGHWYSNTEATSGIELKAIPYGWDALVKPFRALV